MTLRNASFILGCQRSGTTLLRFLLASHPDVCCIDEKLAYPVLAGRKPLPDDIANEAADKLPVFKIPRYAEQLQLDDIRDEVYGTSRQFYEGQPAVFMLRDPRDVVSSMCTLAASREQTWIDAYGRSLVEHRIKHRPGFAEGYATELDELGRRDWPPHLLAAMYWRVKNDAAPRYFEEGLPLLLVSYEALVSDPEPQLRRICTHLGIPWTTTMLAHHDTEHSQLEASGLAIGGSDPKRPIDRNSVGRFSTVLDRPSVDEVDAWTRKTLERLRSVAPPV